MTLPTGDTITDPSTQAGAQGVPTRPGSRTVALIVNPVKVDNVDQLAEQLAAQCQELGWPKPRVLETSEQDYGGGQCRTALDDGADLVLAAGGDGTVRAVAETLVGTGVPLGLIPAGTGNLLARNLGIPLDLDEAVTVALHGVGRTIDVAVLDDTVDGRDDADRITFTVMAGIGFDAAMMRDAPDGLKAAVGWPAYLVGGLKGMRRSRVHVRVELDDGPAQRHTVRTVLIGNCGRLQGGLELLPDADPSDGLLDVAVVSARRPRDLAVLLVRGLRRTHRRDRRLITYQASKVVVRAATSQPRQADGDLVAPGHVLAASVRPAALVVQVPAQE